MDNQSPTNAAFEICTLDPTATPKELLALDPSVVFFDMQAIPPEFLQTHTRSQPDLLLVGVDAESHAVLLAGQAASSITPDQIIQLICRQFP